MGKKIEATLHVGDLKVNYVVTHGLVAINFGAIATSLGNLDKLVESVSHLCHFRLGKFGCKASLDDMLTFGNTTYYLADLKDIIKFAKILKVYADETNHNPKEGS